MQVAVEFDRGVEAARPTDVAVGEALVKSFTWTTAMLPQDRDVEHVAVSLECRVRVVGRTPAPLVTRFDLAWIK